MIIQRINLSTDMQITTPLVVIDVLRAFTTAAYIFAAGAEDITLVSTVEEAFRIKQQHPDYLLAGESNTLPIEGFDFGNSPSDFLNVNLKGKHFVQRTSCGTQGVAQAPLAPSILLGNLCCASATVRYIQNHNWQSVTFNETGIRTGGLGDEDSVCADLLEARLSGKQFDLTEVVRRVKESEIGKKFNGSRPDLPPGDIDLATAIDRFDFAMQVTRRDGFAIATPVYF
ncbi:MAG: 2-phosphosulfolactate phosphatase [Anaerolineae bacterium]|nr:2-phosphosulfolactate phosphatase [Anaerolineae bacterium]